VAILYIDDRVIHLEEMRREFENLLYIKAWESCKSPSDCVKYIEQYLLKN
jgi:predicted phosphatase